MELLGLRFLAPGYLLLLVLPLAALWLGARGGALLALVTGTLEVWRAAQRARPAQQTRKLRIPPALWCIAAALVCGALALARPERAGAAQARRFTIVVDRRPAMQLDDGGMSRLDRALQPVRAWIAKETSAGDEVSWVDAQPAEGGAAPDWQRYDRAGAILVGDRFDPPPRNAGFSASGGAAAPGPIGRAGRTRLDWDGTRVVRVENAYAARELGCSIDPALPAPLREIAGLWAAQQGLATSGGGLFAFVLVRAGELRAVDLARDGWSARARIGAPLAPEAGETTWLASAGPCLLVSKGRVRTSIAKLDEPTGDPAAFAVSWGALLDSALLDPPGIVPLAERTARGAPAWRAPATDGASGAARPLGGPCALLAALLALGAWALRGVRA